MESQTPSALPDDVAISEPPKRKRGRPRKQFGESTKSQENVKKLGSQKMEIYPSMDMDEEIILEMRITADEIKKYKGETVDADQKPNSKVDAVQDNMFTLTDISDTSSSTSSSALYNSYSDPKCDKKTKIKKDTKDNIIKKLRQKIKELEGNSNTVSKKDNLCNNMIKLNLNFIDSESGKVIKINKTDIACWWCAHEFDNLPCFIPDKYYNNTYHIFGCFCSFSCATAYNMNLSDYRVWERHSLINSLCDSIYDQDQDLDQDHNQTHDCCKNNSSIIIAPPREVLKKFGGSISIEEYRKNNMCGEKEYRLILPSMIYATSSVEEKHINKKYYGRNVANNEGFRLKRNKPLPGAHNTLANTMGIIKKLK